MTRERGGPFQEYSPDYHPASALARPRLDRGRQITQGRIQDSRFESSMAQPGARRWFSGRHAGCPHAPPTHRPCTYHPHATSCAARAPHALGRMHGLMCEGRSHKQRTASRRSGGQQDVIASGQHGVINSGQQSSLVVLCLLVEGRQLGLGLLAVRVTVGDRVRVGFGPGSGYGLGIGL